MSVKRVHLLHYQKENTLMHIRKQFDGELITGPDNFIFANC